ncbi:hypothetical protein BV898_14946 [Hypsibius exemplaris]|uniref:Uncharacterized protein n=1 Tax=Hypsibius exemplaris TaxID=2072580 RepID=A0A9X6NBL8_HYPEX|nr:hypothetical protein BV898_14946 [Hypsibius exemplaris]
MNHYNPHMYGVFFNGGYQQFDGHQYSNISSSSFPLTVASPPASVSAEDGTARKSTRPPRTLTNITTTNAATTASLSSSSQSRGKQKDKNDSKPAVPLQRHQEPAYRFSPYAFSHSSLSVSSPSSLESQPQHNLTWNRNPNDFNLLVVPPSSDDAESKTATMAINLRHPSEHDQPQTGIPYSYSYPVIAGHAEAHSYTTTVANRMGMTGPLSLSKARNPAAHSDGIGSYLLRKMGWAGPGVGIGARGNSECEPLASQLELKLNKRGLGLDAPAAAAAGGQGQAGGAASSVSSANSTSRKVDVKLSVAQLNELCMENRWRFPVYDLVHESGPPHSKVFKYTARLNGQQYSGEGMGTKKMAKASAAQACLQMLT